MSCPNCHHELEPGFLYAEAAAWTMRPRQFLFRQSADGYFLQGRRGVRTMEAFRCPACGMIVIGGDEPCPDCGAGPIHGFFQSGGDLAWCGKRYGSMGDALRDRNGLLLTDRFLSAVYPAERCARCGRIWFATDGLTPRQVRAAKVVRRIWPWVVGSAYLLAFILALSRVSWLIWLLTVLGAFLILYGIYRWCLTHPSRGRGGTS